ncbi:MAG: class I SAM-dependent methyltransferase [Bacillota bacterium]
MKRVREENVNTIEYWDRVYARERESGRRRLYTDLWNSMLQYLPPGCYSLVDIGCGAGEFLRFISERRPEYLLYGTDWSVEGLRTAAQCCPQAALYQAVAGSFNLPRDDFDLAVCSEVMEHVPEPASFLDRVIRVVRPSGRILITTPWEWGASDPEHLWDYEGSEDFVALAPGEVELVASTIANAGRTLITVLRRKSSS